MDGVAARRVRGAGRTFYRALAGRPWAAIVLLLGTLYLPWIGALPLGGTLEGNRLESAREMLLGGDWIVPHLGGRVYLAKPPLFPWTLAVVSAPFGNVTATIGRLVTVACAIASCCVVYAWGRREIGRRAALYAALALGASGLFVGKTLRAELEIELALLTSVALLAFWNAGWCARPAHELATAAASGLALGAAALVKGPPPLLVYGACALAVIVRAPAARRGAFARCAACAGILALACAAAWLVPLCGRLGVEPAWRAFHDEFVERITRPGRTNLEPAWFYGPALLVGLLPASLHLPCLGLVAPGRAGADERARLRQAFLWGWALLPLLVFSLSAGKESRYLLTTLPAWALLLAWGWVRARSAGRIPGWRRTVVRALDVGSWVLPPAWMICGSLAFPAARGAVLASGLALLVGRVLYGWSGRRERPAGVLAALVLGVGGAKFAWASTFLEEQRASIPIEEVARAIDSRLEPGEPWMLVGPYRSWLAFAIEHPCSVVPSWSAWREAIPQATPRWALAPETAGEPGTGEAVLLGRWRIDGAGYRLYALAPEKLTQ